MSTDKSLRNIDISVPRKFADIVAIDHRQ